MHGIEEIHIYCMMHVPVLWLLHVQNSENFQQSTHGLCDYHVKFPYPQQRYLVFVRIISVSTDSGLMIGLFQLCSHQQRGM